MPRIRYAILIFAIVILGSLPVACDSPRDETSYGQGYHAGEQNGFKAGFESARPPGFSPESSNVRGILTGIAWLGAIIAGIGCFIFVFYLAGHEENWIAISAKSLVCLLASIAAIIVLAVTAPENLIYFVVLAPAPSNFALLLLLVLVFSFVFYWIARVFVDTLERDLSIYVECFIISAVSFLAVMLLGTFINSMRIAPSPVAYMICYIMMGCTLGVGAAGVRALLRYYERQKAANRER